ncbi:hypothetical protein NC651_004721 [Populus alba x Populus x berolinensis]|nr:hypothetical protein NC651_004721 [Populus alba x Populus x berolinensis]
MRKKRRTVDASLFGDVLPIGWKLSICIKKQAGRVWLACTRYISLQNIHVKMARMRMILFAIMALPVTCRSIETGGCPVEVQMGNKYKCHSAPWHLISRMTCFNTCYLISRLQNGLDLGHPQMKR